MFHIQAVAFELKPRQHETDFDTKHVIFSVVSPQLLLAEYKETQNSFWTLFAHKVNLFCDSSEVRSNKRDARYNRGSQC